MITNLIHNGKLFLSKFRDVGTKKKRSSQWHKVEQKFLDDNPFCAACGTHNELQVHHIKPFHLYPELELDPNNLITLCMDTHECHLKIGHGGNWREYCQEVVQYAAKIKQDISQFKKIATEAKQNRIKE